MPRLPKNDRREDRGHVIKRRKIHEEVHTPALRVHAGLGRGRAAALGSRRRRRRGRRAGGPDVPGRREDVQDRRGHGAARLRGVGPRLHPPVSIFGGVWVER